MGRKMQAPVLIWAVGLALATAAPQAPLGVRTNGECQFRGERSNGKFVRLPEDLAVDTDVFTVVAYPRQYFNIQNLDGSRADGLFGFREIDRRRVAVTLRQSLQDLVDQSAPTKAIKFRLACKGRNGATDYLPVTVFIDDVNDNIPEFLGGPYHVNVEESAQPGLTIFRGISAFDRDKPSTANSEISYSITKGNEERKFSLEGRSGAKTVLVLRKKLDYDQGDRFFNLTIRAQDHGSPPLSSLSYITIKVTDSDDLKPRFTEKKYTAVLKENYPITGSPIQSLVSFTPSQVEAMDGDKGLAATLHYAIKDNSEQQQAAGFNVKDYFSIDTATGQIYQIKEIDRESLPKALNDKIHFEVEAAQMDNPLKTDSVPVDILISDVNDNIPHFSKAEQRLSLPENVSPGRKVMTFQATDNDKGVNQDFLFSLKDDPTGAFKLHPNTGLLTLEQPEKLDRERSNQISLKVGLLEVSPSVRQTPSEEATLHITLTDENDNSPVFVPSNVYAFSVPRAASRPHLIGTVRAVDTDEGRNARVEYQLRPSSDQGGQGNEGLFGVDPTTGEIRIKAARPLVEEKYTLFVTATDQPEDKSSRKTSLAIVNIRVEGPRVPKSTEEASSTGLGRQRQAQTPRPSVQTTLPTTTTTRAEELPELSFPIGYQGFEVSRGSKKGTLIGQVIIHNPENIDLRWTMRHRYRHGVPFGIDRQTGKVGLVKDIGPRALENYYVKVSADPKTPGLSKVTTEVKIQVKAPVKSSANASHTGNSTAAADASPGSKQQQIVKEQVTVYIKENLKDALVSNLTQFQLDKSEPGLKEYVIQGLDGDLADKVKEKFSITDSGLLYTKSALDRESESSFNLTIVKGRGILRGKECVRINVVVLDDNDNSPAFDRHIYQGTIQEGAKAGEEVEMNRNRIRVTDPDLSDRIQLKLLGKGADFFELDASSGRVTLLQDLVTSAFSSDPNSNKDKFYLRIRAVDLAGHITESQLVIRLLPAEESTETPASTDSATAIVSVSSSAPRVTSSVSFSPSTSATTRLNPVTVTDTTTVATARPIFIRGLQVKDRQRVQLVGNDTLSVLESSAPGGVLAKILVSPGSAEAGASLVFQIEKESIRHLRNPKRHVERKRKEQRGQSAHFKIDSPSGDLMLIQSLSSALAYSLHISVSSSVSGQKTGFRIEVVVADVNDHAPKFQQTKYDFILQEGRYFSQDFGSVFAKDEDLGANGNVTYSLQPSPQSLETHSDLRRLIKIDPATGVLTINGTLDREQGSHLEFRITAQDNAEDVTKRKQDHTDLTIEIRDQNDHAPMFFGYNRLEKVSTDLGFVELVKGQILAVYELEIGPEAQPGETLLELRVNDSDASMRHNKVRLRLLNTNAKALPVRLDAQRGRIVFTRRPEQPVMEMYVVATDGDRESVAVVRLRRKRTFGIVEKVDATEQPQATEQPTTRPLQPETEAPILSQPLLSSEPAPPRLSHIFRVPRTVAEVSESVSLPIRILDLRAVVDEELMVKAVPDSRPKFRILGDDYSMFRLDQDTGYLMLTAAPDRETRDSYELRIQSFITKANAKDDVTFTLYVNGDKKNSNILAEDELTVEVLVLDSNDNKPEFLTYESPIMVSVSSELPVGEMVAKIEAWDADEGLNSDLRYKIVTPTTFFAMDSLTGDLSLQRPLKGAAGKTYRLEVEARDRRGSEQGLSSAVIVAIHILGNEQLLRLVLEREVGQVNKEVQNITSTLSDLSGLKFRSHMMEPHRVQSSEQLKTEGHPSLTDLYVYGIDDQSNELVETERIVRNLGPNLQETATMLAPHGLIELRAMEKLVMTSSGELGAPRGNPKATPALSEEDASSEESGSPLGSLEIGLLAMACAIFFGALIAIVTICSLRYRRSQKSYPAPLAIPLPSYLDGAPGPPNALLATPTGPSSLATVVTPTSILHHGAPGRQSAKSYRSHTIQLESSEDTSDTCIDDHQHSDRFHKLNSSRRSSKSAASSAGNLKKHYHKNIAGSAGLAPHPHSWSKLSQRHQSARDLRDLPDHCVHCRAVGVSFGPNGSNKDLMRSLESECESCSECELDSRHQSYAHFTRSPSQKTSHSSSRRHKSASPSRKSCSFNPRVDINELTPPTLSGGSGRSKSAGRAATAAAVVPGCAYCTSMMAPMPSCSCCHHCLPGQLRGSTGALQAGLASGPRAYWDWDSRSQPQSKSTRSTRWEVYHAQKDAGRDEMDAELRKRKSLTYNNYMSDSPSESGAGPTSHSQRVASSNAAKAHSWRGDHPMKGTGQVGGFFQHEARKIQQQQAANSKIGMPFRTTYTYGEDHQRASANKE